MSDVGASYRGPSGIARDSEWMTNEDVDHKADTVLTIEDVKFYKSLKFGPRSEERKLSIKFKERKRELVLNSTNRKTAALLFGPDTTDWIGRKIALWVEQDVRRPDNTRGPAVRFRAKRLPQDAGSTNAAKAATVPAKPESVEPVAGQAEHDPIDAEFERHAEHQARVESDDGIA